MNDRFNSLTVCSRVQAKMETVKGVMGRQKAQLGESAATILTLTADIEAAREEVRQFRPNRFSRLFKFSSYFICLSIFSKQLRMR